MIKKKYKIANKVVEINSIYNDVHKYCFDYLSDENADYCIYIQQSDIEYERKKSEDEDIKNNISVREFSEGYFEELAVYRKIAEKMIEFNTLLFHGAVISVDGSGYMFVGKSGTGKSTHAKLWKELLGNKVINVNDDKPLISIEDKVIAYGTPYNGKHRIGSNTAVQLKAICILVQSKNNSIEKVSPKQAFTELLKSIYYSSDLQKMKKELTLIENVIERCNLYKLYCNTDIEAAKIAYEEMK